MYFELEIDDDVLKRLEKVALKKGLTVDELVSAIVNNLSGIIFFYYGV